MTDSGLMGLPFPVYSAIDSCVSGLLGAPGSMIFWALTCSMAVMFLYRLCSPQTHLKILKQRMREIQAELTADPDDLQAALRLSGKNISIALKRFLLTFLPTCVAILPLLSVTAWINSKYGPSFCEDGTVIQVQAHPEGMHILSPTPNGAIMTNSVAAASGTLTILKETGKPLLKISGPARASFIARKRWWNWLMGNPMGYLPDDADVEAVVFDFKRQEILPFGPDWMRRWEALFFFCMTIASIALKIVFKVE